MGELVDLIVKNGIGVLCVAYLIYFQSTTMKSIENVLHAVEQRLCVIEDKLERKGVSQNEIE